ncbi:MAG TPA: FUSC family membrane protein [Castellaniella sp.]|nr:FUSC family membrane protein [Castellaniella sp.]
MSSALSQFQRFIYSHYFFGGVRQALGVLLPALIVAGWLQLYAIGMVAAIGAACVAVLDQPGGPRRYGINGMLAALFLGSLTAAASGLASGHPAAVWLVVPILCFIFSMFTVFGRQGGLLGFACLLIMTLTMRTPLSTADVLQHTAYSFLGGVFYLAYSALAHRLMWHREQQQALSVALFATADYMSARARFYDVNIDLDDSYRKLIRTQALMTDAHQAARDMVLRELPRGKPGRGDRLRQSSLNIFIDMVDLLDSMIATHTDYATLRRALPESDILLFVRDALNKLSVNVSMIALNVARNRHTRQRNSVKAELRALEYEMEQARHQGMESTQPETYALLIQIQRRMRNITRLVDRMAGHSERRANEDPVIDPRLNKSLNRFLQRRKWRLGMLTSNLRSDSPHFRYATRVAIAALLAMTVAAVLGRLPLLQDVAPGMAAHGYWIILTVIIIMKPGFALTRQRNGWRLTGTLIGCAAALGLFTLTHNTSTLLAILVLCSILGYSLIQVNYMLSAVFNTMFVLLVFHFLVPGSNAVVGERLIDTVIGSILALSCSYILPSWERGVMVSLAQALRKANRHFLNTGLAYALSARTARASGLESDQAQAQEASTSWRVARKNMHIAFGNFASAFYRMMDEPARRQRHVPELNNLLIQHHALASQISAAIPILAQQDEVPPGIRQALDATQAYLNDHDMAAPTTLETDGELATLAYPLRQMVKAASLIRNEMQGLTPET